MDVSATRKKTGKTVKLTYDMPADLDAMIAKYGRDITYNHAKGSMIVALQGFVRGLMDKDTPQEEIQAKVNEWKPGQRKPSASPQEKLSALVAKMSPDELKAFIAKHRDSGGTTSGVASNSTSALGGANKASAGRKAA